MSKWDYPDDPQPRPDPVEMVIEDALRQNNIAFVREWEDDERTKGLDFYLPGLDIHLEVKRFHSPRIAAQMSRVPNVIVIQGIHAVGVFAKLLRPQEGK